MATPWEKKIADRKPVQSLYIQKMPWVPWDLDTLKVGEKNLQNMHF